MKNCSEVEETPEDRDMKIIGDWVCPNCKTLNYSKHCRNCCTNVMLVRGGKKR